MLRFAGQAADAVGINASLRAGELGRHAVIDLSEDRVETKVGWVREGARSAGRDPDGIELEMNNWLVRITRSASDAEQFLTRIAARFDVDPVVMARSPSVLVGTVDQCRDRLEERRDRFGISFFQLDAGFPPDDVEALAPLVGSLAGR